jgi:hypothetical protein
MRFVARAKLAIFVAAFASREAVAAPPFTIVPPNETIVSTTVPGNVCQNYDAQLSLNGAPLSGVNHPGYCQFSSGQITLNGMPFNQFWQGVSTGAVPPPFHVTYSQRGGMVCATGTDLDLKISMRIETSRLDWPGAASVGMACLAEWNRHSPASLVSSTATATSASNALSRLANILNNRLPKSFEGCAPPSPQRNSRTQPALAALAAELAAFMRKGVDEAQHSWGPQGASGQACSLHCNLCSSGWAGTITATKTLTSGQPYFGQTATFYVGGTSQIPNRFLAEWTTSGQGKYTDPNYGSVKEWKLNADVAGQCDPLGKRRLYSGAYARQHHCVHGGQQPCHSQ